MEEVVNQRFDEMKVQYISFADKIFDYLYIAYMNGDIDLFSRCSFSRLSYRITREHLNQKLDGAFIGYTVEVVQPEPSVNFYCISVKEDLKHWMESNKLERENNAIRNP